MTSTIFLSIAIFGIISILCLTSTNASGQTGNGTTLLDDWDSAKYAQGVSIAEQNEFSRLAQDLQAKITERDAYLTNLLQTLNTNPTEDTSEEPFTSECVIATAAFGSNLAPQVQFLRDFRDSKIKSTVAGSSFMQAFEGWYYSFSPSVAEYERGQPWLQSTIRFAITPLLSILQLSENGYSMLYGESGALAAGFIASSLIGIVYFGPIAFVALSRKPCISMSIIQYSLIVVGGSGCLIAIGVFLENSEMLMYSTATFVLSILVASSSFAAMLFHSIAKRRGWIIIHMMKRQPGANTYLAPFILVFLIICLSESMTAFASAPNIPPQALSRNEIEDQLSRLSEIKSWLDDTRRIESFFPDMVETHALTSRLIDFFNAYGQGQLSDKAFHEAVQSASVGYQKFSSKIYNDGVADSHFTIKDTLSSAVLQLSYSTSDLVKARTCECDAQQASEFFSSSQLSLATSSQNFYSYSQMLQSEDRQLQFYITEIETMPNGA